MNYAVTWSSDARNSLALIWIQATDRSAVTSAQATIDHLLSTINECADPIQAMSQSASIHICLSGENVTGAAGLLVQETSSRYNCAAFDGRNERQLADFTSSQRFDSFHFGKSRY